MLEIVGREADGGRRCAPVGCGTARAGPPIDSGRGPMRIAAAAQARAVVMPGLFTVHIRTGNQNQTSFYPFVPHEISVLVELILGKVIRCLM